MNLERFLKIGKKKILFEDLQSNYIRRWQNQSKYENLTGLIPTIGDLQDFWYNNIRNKNGSNGILPKEELKKQYYKQKAKTKTFIAFLRRIRYASYKSGSIRLDRVQIEKITDDDIYSIPISDIEKSPLKFKDWLLFWEDQNHRLIYVTSGLVIFMWYNYDSNQTKVLRYRTKTYTSIRTIMSVCTKDSTYCYGIKNSRLKELYMDQDKIQSRIEWSEFVDFMDNYLENQTEKRKAQLRNLKIKKDLKIYQDKIDKIVEGLDKARVMIIDKFKKASNEYKGYFNPNTKLTNISYGLSNFQASYTLYINALEDVSRCNKILKEMASLDPLNDIRKYQSNQSDLTFIINNKLLASPLSRFFI